MHQDNLLCLRRKSFVVTTDSRHNLPVYPNLAGTITPVRVNQLWRADITYIRLRTEFIYLAVVLDTFSRRVIGWAVGRTLEAGLAVSALTIALRQRQPAPGMVYNSDRGVQYASPEYTDLLKQQGAQISMSRKGNPYDNAACESFMKTLKYEEVYRTEYRDLADAYAQIGQFLERVYNQQRLHSALGYVPARRVRAERREYPMTWLRDESSSWGRCPQTPGIYRIPAGMTERGGRSLCLRSFRPLSRRSSCVPAELYPPLKFFQSGLPQPRRAMICQRTAITPLTCCLIPGVQFTWPLLFCCPPCHSKDKRE